MRIMQIAGIILILVGFLFFINVIPLVSLVVDTTPPVVSTTVPSNGTVYQSIDKLTVYCYDTDSGIASVTTVIDSTSYTLNYISKEPQSPYQIWELSLSTPITTSKTYSFSTTVKNNAGLTTTVSGTFIIYTQLQGKWFVNDQEITSTSQTVYSSSTTVSFKFQKTAGIADSYLSCWVEEGGTKILTLTLTNSTNHIWTGSYTFSTGTHNLALKTNDGTSTITMNIVGLQIGEEWTAPSLPPIALNQLLGVGLMVVGAVLVFQKKW
jgi:hypothetical protein